jgi:CheY-like chemotaxis protein
MRMGPVILLERDDESRSVYEEALRRAGLSVVAVSTCDDAFEASTYAHPRVIVANFDANTRAQCVALCERLKGDGRTRAVPVILASTNIDDADIRKATDAHVLALALRPLHAKKLVAAVRGVLVVADGRESISPPERKIRRPA